MIDSSHSHPGHGCSGCGEGAEKGGRQDWIGHLIEVDGAGGTETKFISTDFEKGEQLHDAFGGIAGILRYSTGV